MNRRKFFRFLAATPIAIAAAPALASATRGTEAIVPLARPTLSQLRVSAEVDCDAYIRAIIAKSNDVILRGLRDHRNRTGI